MFSRRAAFIAASVTKIKLEDKLSLVQKYALFVQKVLLKIGIVVKRSSFYSREDLRLLQFLKIHEVDTVLDVGANRGEYAMTLIRGGFKGHIYSFEALPEMHSELIKRAAMAPGRWIVAPQCAIAAEKGMAKFNIMNAISASSLFMPTDRADDMRSIFNIRETIEVPTDTLAACCKSLGILSQRIFLKLDIQGGEESALRGAEALLPQIVGIVAEMPLQIYYEGQATARQLDGWITSRGFELWDIQPAWRHPTTGRLNHIDAMYVKAPAVDRS